VLRVQNEVITWKDDGKRLLKSISESSFLLYRHYALVLKPSRHLNQIQLTADGNFHANRYKKNSSEKDYSLFRGLAYYPLAEVYTDYLSSLPTNDHLEV